MNVAPLLVSRNVPSRTKKQIPGILLVVGVQVWRGDRELG